MIKPELIISYFLRVGVIVCGLLLAVGIFSSWARPAYRAQQEKSVMPILLSGHTLEDQGTRVPYRIVIKALHGDTQALIDLAVMGLIFLPIFRVALTVFIFTKERDWIFVGITLLVLGVLIMSLFLGGELSSPKEF
jgi:uncharacterized membrane protein